MTEVVVDRMDSEPQTIEHEPQSQAIIATIVIATTLALYTTITAKLTHQAAGATSTATPQPQRRQ